MKSLQYYWVKLTDVIMTNLESIVGCFVLFSVLIFVYCILYAGWSSIEQAETKRQSFKYKIQVHDNNTYFTDAYAYSDGILTFFDGINSNNISSVNTKFTVTEQSK